MSKYLLIFSFLVSLLLSFQPLDDPDMGWQIAVGKWMVEQEAIPTTEPLAYSLPHHSYINHSWLFSLLIYLVYSGAGLIGVNLFFGLILTLGMYALYLIVKAETQNEDLSLLIFLLTPLVVSYLGLRSHLVTFTMLSWLLVLLINNRSPIRRRSSSERSEHEKYSWGARFAASSGMTVIPLLFLLWAQLHGGFIFGFGTILLYLGYLLFFNLNRFKQVVASLLIALVLSLVAVGLNPYGLSLYSQVLTISSNPLAGQLNLDWVSLISPLLPQETVFLRVGIIIAVVTSLVVSRKFKFWQFGSVVLLGLTLWSQRFLLPLILMQVIVWGEYVTGYLTNKEKHDKSLEKKMVGGILLLGLVAQGFYLVTNWCTFTSIECLSQYGRYPYESVQVLKEVQAERVWNFYSWGGYLDWQLPETKVFIDGRMDTYETNGETFITVFDRIVQAKEGWEEDFSMYPADWVLVPPQMPLVDELKEMNWEVVVENEHEVLLRRISETI